jgi:hypothetical protein
MNPSFSIATALAVSLVVGLPPAQAAEPTPCQPRSLGFDAADAGWKPVPMSRRKKDTVYEVEREDQRTVLVARAEGAASFYVARLPTPIRLPATLSWSWKTDALVPGADNRDKRREDAPLRVVVAFDGDASMLPAGERTQRALAESLSGQAPPYAALMYIWSDQVAPETIIPSAHTSQIKMIVVASGTQGLGTWQSVRRDLAADYRRAYGAEPGPILGVAVLTDTDNTGAKAEGRYADIRLQCPAG